VTNIVAAVVVRMGSSRLPGKTLAEVNGTPLLGFLVNRLKQSNLITDIVVATTDTDKDDPIAAYCATNDLAIFRGSEDDVLGRMVGAYQSRDADICVEAFGDGPLIDPAVVDLVIQRSIDTDGAADLVGNDMKTTYPPGMDVEAFSMAAFAKSETMATDPAIREHGTGFMRQNPDIFRLVNIEAPDHQRRPELEIEVDTAEDFEVVKTIIEHFAPRIDFTVDEIIAFLDTRPDIAAINQSVHRRWKEYRDDDD
jgi:spore coat polysaccharide biosynthesis protein SpsF